jgi:hypothetical protein
MAILLTIEFERNLSAFKHQTRVCGKALKDPRCKLNQLAQRLGLRPLYAFFHADQEQWFERTFGLLTVQGLPAQLRHQPVGVCPAAHSIADLEVFEQVLTTVESNYFRLSVQSLGRQTTQ